MSDQRDPEAPLLDSIESPADLHDLDELVSVASRFERRALFWATIVGP